MKPFAVIVAPAARADARQISEWWHLERPKAPSLFDQELEAAFARLGRAPTAAPSYRESRGRTVRRLLMPRTSHHVYFEIDGIANVVRVLAVWHTSRGQGPTL